MPKIVQCPFCDSDNIYLVDGYYVECAKCDARGPRQDTEALAIVKWNAVARIMKLHKSDS